MWLGKMAADPAIETEVIKRRKRPDFVTRDHGSQLPGHESGEYVQRQGCPLPLPDRRSCQQSSAQNAREAPRNQDRKSTRLNSSHRCISYAVFCLKKKKNIGRGEQEQQRRVERRQLSRW